MNTSQEIKEVLKKYKPELEKEYNVSLLGLFGSYARNEQHESSDVDILIDFSQPIGLQFVDIAERLETILGRKVDLVSKNAVKPKLLKYIQQDIQYV